MAFDKLYEFPDRIKKEYEKAEANGEYKRAAALMDSLLIYYDTVCQTPKFRSQRDHTRSVMEKINPALCEGYFKSKS